MDATTKAIREKLLEVARNGSTITYGELGKAVGLHWRSRRLVDALDVINRHEDGENRPLLTAVVVNAESKRSGPGFFNLAEALGRFDPAKDDERAYWEQERQRVYRHWAP